VDWRIGALLTPFAALLAACGPLDAGGSAQYCSTDQQCDYQCSRLGECLDEGEAITVRVNWTIEGQAAGETSCADIQELRLTFEPDSIRDEEVTYAPVPCELGTIYYDRMPDRFSAVRLTALGDRLYLEGWAEVQGAETVATIDLRP
jgi:hypothetical protein